MNVLCRRPSHQQVHTSTPSIALVGQSSASKCHSQHAVFFLLTVAFDECEANEIERIWWKTWEVFYKSSRELMKTSCWECYLFVCDDDA